MGFEICSQDERKRRIGIIMSKEKLEQNGCEKETLTIKECINRLETLFRSYSKDSEFNYQLSVSDSPFNQLKKLVSWQPIENYQVGKHDWVLVQFEEKDTKFRCIPIVAEFRNGKWHSKDDSIGEETYLNEICKAIAFVDMQEQIIPIEKENKDEKMSKELTPLKALNDLIDYLESEHLDLSKEDHVVERKQIIEDALEDYEETKFLYEDLMEQYELVMDLIEQYELKIKNKSKKLKALEIIKEKDVNIRALKSWNKTYKGKLNYQNYLGILEDCDLGEKLTKEEFDILKEVLL